MSISRINLISDEAESIRFDIHATTQSQYLIRNIVGLDADEIVPRFYGFSKDGTKRFYDSKLKQREIVMRIVVNPRYNLGEDNSYVRNQLYKMIAASRTGKIDLEFFSGSSAMYKVSGSIVKFEVPYFSNQPELQITIKCNDPMFRGVAPTKYVGDDIPTTNPIVIADGLSTAPHGFFMAFTLTSVLSSIIIQDKETDPEWDFTIDPAWAFAIGDQIWFSSEFTNRYIYHIRGSTWTHMLDTIHPESVWPMIYPGMNEFHFPGISGITFNEFSFYPAFWGV